MSDLYAVIRRERELRLPDVERQRALGLIEPRRPLRWFRANVHLRVGKPIASRTHGTRGETGPRPVSPR
jgi:hypothetical protein